METRREGPCFAPRFLLRLPDSNGGCRSEPPLFSCSGQLLQLDI